MLVKNDFRTHLYDELITAIDRDQDDVFDDAIAFGEGQAEGYLSRYDTETLFGAQGEARDPVLMGYVKDLVVWHFIALANPDTDMELRKTRHDEAVTWLKDVQSGKVEKKNWPLPVEETPGDSGIWKGGARAVRETRF